jgi:hypothetical protein
MGLSGLGLFVFVQNGTSSTNTGSNAILVNVSAFQSSVGKYDAQHTRHLFSSAKTDLLIPSLILSVPVYSNRCCASEIVDC